MTFFMSSCSKDDEPSHNPDWICQGPDEIIADGLIRVNNLLYQVNEDNTCTLICSQKVYESDGTSKSYYSTSPYPVFDIPDKVTLKGKTYHVTAVNLDDYFINRSDVKYLSIPSSVLSYNGGEDLNLLSLSIGANVRKVSNVKAKKILVP